MKLTPKQEAFVREYIVDLNGAAAARRAGYSDKMAGRIASQLLDKPHVNLAIQAAMNDRAERTEITADRVLQEIAVMAFYDPGVIGAGIEDGTIIRGPQDISKLPSHVRRAIVGWSWDKAGNFTLKLADKLNALDKLGRHLKLFTDKTEITGPNGTPLVPPLTVSPELLKEVLASRLDEV